MTIIRDDGLYRHLQFRKPEHSNYHYELITWPGYLCICGDIGTSVFRRVEDMFKFFRGERINPPYWGEKLQAIGTYTGYEEFSESIFQERVKDHFDEWEFENDEQKKETWEDIEQHILEDVSRADGSWPAYNAVYSYKGPYGHRFQDFFDGGGCNEFTFHYIWVLYAIVEGIRQYDATRKLA